MDPRIISEVPRGKDQTIRRMRALDAFVDADGSATSRASRALRRAARPLERTWIRTFMVGGDGSDGELVGGLAALTSDVVCSNVMTLKSAFRMHGIFPGQSFDIDEDCEMLFVPCMTIGGETVGIAVERCKSVNGTGIHAALNRVLTCLHGGKAHSTPVTDTERAVGKFYFSAVTGELLVLTRKMLLEHVDAAVAALSGLAGLWGINLGPGSAFIDRRRWRVMWWSGGDTSSCRGGRPRDVLKLGQSNETLVAVVDTERFCRGQYDECIIVSRVLSPQTNNVYSSCATGSSHAFTTGINSSGNVGSKAGVKFIACSEDHGETVSDPVQWGGVVEVSFNIPGFKEARRFPKLWDVSASLNFDSSSSSGVAELRKLAVSRLSLAIDVKKFCRRPVNCSCEGSPDESNPTNNARCVCGECFDDDSCSVDLGGNRTSFSVISKSPQGRRSRGCIGVEKRGRRVWSAEERRNLLLERAERNRRAAAISNEKRRQRNLKLREDLKFSQSLVIELRKRRAELALQNSKLREEVEKRGHQGHSRRYESV